MDGSSLSPSTESLVLDLFCARKALTLEQVVNLLPELSWSQVFEAVDQLGRRGEIILLRRGFEYSIEKAWTKRGALAGAH